MSTCFARIRFICLLTLLFVQFPVLSGIAATPDKGINPGLLLEGKIHYGFIVPHHPELNIFYARFPSFEISVGSQTSGKNAWERLYNYPIIGVTFFYSGMGNNPDLRQTYALMPYINFPLSRADDFTATFRLAIGMGYFPKIYDSIKNPLNVAIGTHLNAAINLMFEARYQVSKHVTLTGGISFQHFSNGGWKMPNYGLNMPLLNLGIAYRPTYDSLESQNMINRKKEPLPEFDRRRIDLNFGAGICYKNRTNMYGENFILYHIHENTFFPVSRKSKFGFGFDISYDPSQIKALELEGSTISKKSSYILPGINAGYALVISKLEILLNLGFYPGKIRPNGYYYEKLSIQYNFSKHFFAQVMLKAHGTTAAYVAWSAGYRIGFNYGKKKEQHQIHETAGRPL